MSKNSPFIFCIPSISGQIPMSNRQNQVYKVKVYKLLRRGLFLLSFVSSRKDHIQRTLNGFGHKWVQPKLLICADFCRKLLKSAKFNKFQQFLLNPFMAEPSKRLYFMWVPSKFPTTWLCTLIFVGRSPKMV